jgi:hypothetical protein
MTKAAFTHVRRPLSFLKENLFLHEFLKRYSAIRLGGFQ